jgi:ribosome-associated protein
MMSVADAAGPGAGGPGAGGPGAGRGSEDLARRIAGIADAKKASDLIALDMRSLVGYTDFLVICTARTERQSKAIHDEVYVQLKRDGRLPARVEGEREARWVLMDYLDCILHVFTPETRDRYRLDVLWGEAERLDLGLRGAA